MLSFDDRDGPGPAGRSALDLGRKAADREADRGQRLEIVQLLDMAIADMATRLVALPDDRGVRVTGIDGWSWDAPFVHTAKRYA